MKYTFRMKKYNGMERLSIYTKNETFDIFFSEFLMGDAFSFNKPLLAMIDDVKKGIKESEFFSGNAFEVEIKKEFSKLSTNYPVNQMSEYEIKTDELFDIISAYLNELKKDDVFRYKLNGSLYK